MKTNSVQLQIKMISTATDMHGRLLVLETFPTNASVPPRVDALAGMKRTWSPSTLKDMRSLIIRQVQNLRLGVLPKCASLRSYWGRKRPAPLLLKRWLRAAIIRLLTAGRFCACIIDFIF